MTKLLELKALLRSASAASISGNVDPQEISRADELAGELVRWGWVHMNKERIDRMPFDQRLETVKELLASLAADLGPGEAATKLHEIADQVEELC
jgi:hypothetical protein